MRFLNTCSVIITLSGFLSAAELGGDSQVRLIEAAKNGDARTVRALIEKHVPLNTAEVDGSTALHEAVRYDQLEIADLLIAGGANVKAATRYKITPLSLACSNGNAAMIERLLKAGADANSTSEEGQTALMTAALAGKVEAVKTLLAHGAQVNTQEPIKGQSALMWAASEGRTAAAGILIEFGADVKPNRKAGSRRSCSLSATATRRRSRYCWATAPMPTMLLPMAPARSTWR